MIFRCRNLKADKLHVLWYAPKYIYFTNIENNMNCNYRITTIESVYRSVNDDCIQCNHLHLHHNYRSCN